MKNSKKLLAIILSLAMIISCLSGMLTVNAAMPVTETTVYFEDNFSTDGDLKTGWVSNTNANLAVGETFVANGVISKPVGNATQLGIMKKMDTVANDYTVQADVILPQVDADVYSSSAYIIGIFSRATAALSGGFEFQLYFFKSSATVRLFDRSKKITDDGLLATNSDVEIAMGNTYNLKIKATGNVINCYLDDALVISYTDENSVYASGGAGIRFPSSTVAGAVDNFSIYNVYTQPCLFADDFSTYNVEKEYVAMSQHGWGYVNSKKSAYIDKEAENITLTADCNINPYLINTSAVEGSRAWSDYSVEADITFASGTVSANIYSGVVGRTVTNGTDGYEISVFLLTDGTSGLRILRRGDTNVTLKTVNIDVERDTVYNLKAVFCDDMIYAYLNENLIATAKDSTYSYGYAAIRNICSQAPGIEISYDNFVVYEYTGDKIIFGDSFDTYVPTEVAQGYDFSALQANGWKGATNAVTNAAFRSIVPFADNGTYTIPAGLGNHAHLYLANNADAANWSDYTVTAKVTVGENLYEDKTDSSVYISLRDSAYNVGYYVRIQFKNGVARWITLYDSQTSGRTALGAQYIIGTNERSATVDLKIVADGSSISVYAAGLNDDNALISVEDTAHSTGYAGIHYVYSSSTINAADVSIDDFMIYDHNYEATVIGDVDGNGVRESADLVAMRTALLTNNTDVSVQDFNEDGVVDIRDLVSIKKFFI